MTKMTPRTTFNRAMRDRLANRPFVDISAYKVRESRGNIESTISTVTEIVDFVSRAETHLQPALLGGCTSEDKAIWLKDLPNNLAYELGYNLIPAIEALSVEGVPKTAIQIFIQSMTGSVHQLLHNCDAVQAATSRSIKGEYILMKQDRSEMLRVCKDALHLADRALAFCDAHGV